MGIKKVPFDYEHPNKRKRGAQAPALEPTDKPKSAIKKKKDDMRNGSVPARKSKTAPAAQTELMRLVVYPPIKGQVETYDQMIEAGIAPKQAILGLLKRGFSGFETSLLAGKVVT